MKRRLAAHIDLAHRGVDITETWTVLTRDALALTCTASNLCCAFTCPHNGQQRRCSTAKRAAFSASFPINENPSL